MGAIVKIEGELFTRCKDCEQLGEEMPAHSFNGCKGRVHGESNTCICDDTELEEMEYTIIPSIFKDKTRYESEIPTVCCTTCAYGIDHIKDSSVECVRYPPVHDPNLDGLIYEGVPCVHPLGWCGEWKKYTGQNRGGMIETKL